MERTSTTKEPGTGKAGCRDRGPLLVVDDDELIRWSLRHRFEAEYEIIEATTGEEALRRLARGVDLVLLDYKLPDVDGFSLLEQMLSLEPETPIIILTAHSSVDRAVQAMKLGAYHYVSKPFDIEEVSLLVARALELYRMRRKILSLQPDRGFDCIVGESAAMRECKQLLARVAESRSTTVLITGETGTGKDLAATAIHESSERSAGPFVNITCTALSQTLLESELFGHERGAFTDAKTRKKGLLARAHGGTVFFDEIGEMDPALQAKLLRVIEEHAFRPVGAEDDVRTDVRIIAATNVDLAEAVREGRFREDLYYRLAVLRVHLPPLREREGDVELLVEYFLQHFSRQLHTGARKVSRSALRRLTAYSWPGNVRELRNAVERAVLLATSTTLQERDFEMVKTLPARPEISLPPGGLDIKELERDLLVQALRQAGGNRTVAGELLGLNRDQVRYRVEKYSLK